MAIQISGCTVIDNNRNITNANNMCVGVVTMTGSSGNIETPGTITVGGLNFPATVVSFNPADNATDIEPFANIVITYDQLIVKGSGNITLRDGSATGTILQTIDVNSGSVSINEKVVTINPPSNLPVSANVYVVVDEGAFTNLNINTPSQKIDTYNFTIVDFDLDSTTPANSATGVAAATNITLTFNGPPTRGTGTITLRRDTSNGTVLATFDAASSDRISISGNNWILDPADLLPDGFTTIFPIIPASAITNYSGLNVAGANSYSFTTGAAPSLGSSYQGGFLICQASSTRWVVAPSNAQVLRSYHCRDDANTRAQQVSGCTGWFVPTCGQLKNPGYVCRTYWDSVTPGLYWSDSCAGNPSAGWAVDMSNGGTPTGFPGNRVLCPYPVRSFRCVTYL